jgi:hypothetical protein
VLKYKALIICFFLFGWLFQGHSQSATDSIAKYTFFPDLDGILKTKVELDLQDNLMRFQVRNARFGVRGRVNSYVSYRAEIDLSDEGRIKMLDAFVSITPWRNLDIYLGQRKVPFGTDYIRSPADNLFANRSFVAKYVNNGLRDIGLVVNYNFKLGIPFEWWMSAMNGTGNNNPQWINHPNYSARLLVSPTAKIRFAGNFYQGSTLVEKKLTMIGSEFRFMTKKFLLESEYLYRHYSDTNNIINDQYGFYVHSTYHFPTKNKMVKLISPVARWDFMGRKTPLPDLLADRITLGVNFGFDMKPFIAEVRLNYENYFHSYYPIHFDKVTIEFVAKF